MYSGSSYDVKSLMCEIVWGIFTIAFENANGHYIVF